MKRRNIHIKVPKPFKRTASSELNEYVLHHDGAQFADEYIDAKIIFTNSAIPNPYTPKSDYYKWFQSGINEVYNARAW